MWGNLTLQLHSDEIWRNFTDCVFLHIENKLEKALILYILTQKWMFLTIYTISSPKQIWFSNSSPRITYVRFSRTIMSIQKDILEITYFNQKVHWFFLYFGTFCDINGVQLSEILLDNFLDFTIFILTYFQKLISE